MNFQFLLLIVCVLSGIAHSNNKQCNQFWRNFRHFGDILLVFGNFRIWPNFESTLAKNNMLLGKVSLL